MRKLARLYLDTARLGLMSPSAQLAARDFARLAGEGISTLYFQRFLRVGVQTLDSRLRRQLSGLALWKGLEELKNSLRQISQCPLSIPVLLASRSTVLMRLAAQSLFSRCRHVLVADTNWPAYQQIAAEECRQRECRITRVSLRDEIFGQRLSAADVAEHIAAAFVKRGCDGLFLTAVSHDGIRLPIVTLLSSLRVACRLRMVVIDGAQELAHCPVNLADTKPDIYLAGCHKWVGGHMPLGAAFIANPDSSSDIADSLSVHFPPTALADPLLPFLESQGSATQWSSTGETVNLMPLVCAAGALHDLARDCRGQANAFQKRRANAAQIEQIATAMNWRILRGCGDLRSGVLLIKPHNALIRQLPATDHQALWESQGITVTAYQDGLLRFAMPDRIISSQEWEAVARALRGAWQFPLCGVTATA